ncbi:hypothetical protein LRP30_07475 [Bradyrhizobium sp. C-145]|uniref:hypothetical protein n=1 Tax=Bradyrhizobium sp. C-145 TaxID=574727 RepID=UPI00201B924A|nr:hypothetical protein [Bradyrhizobium sp. C-145]UQR65087.1 hypothetical protein LRP30_07475 [Bradyrhizobium sp. C-145]
MIETDDAIARAARIIDQHAFRQENPSVALARRQQIAIRKARDVLSFAAAERDDLVAALARAHEQIDALFAMYALKDHTFRLSETELWPEIVRRNEILRRYGIEPK